MSILMLVVLAAIVSQLNIGTGTDARVARNDVAITGMDLAIESALLQVYEELAADAEADGAGGEAGAPPPAGGGGDDLGEPGAAGAAGAEASEPVDSREDEWARIKRPQIGDIELRVLVQDEDSKINPLGMLAENEEEAELVFERVVRVLDLCREGTSEDIDAGDARLMAEAIRDFLQHRDDQDLPRPRLLTDSDDEREQGLPLALSEFRVLEPFHEGHFRDYRDEDGVRVHSVGSFLTVWSSVAREADLPRNRPNASAEDPDDPDEPEDPAEPDPDPGEGGDEGDDGEGESGQPAGAASKRGVAVNVNTAPPVVLKSLLDDRELPLRWWDDVIEYRNLEEEDEDAEDQDPIYDEFGNEIFRRQVFDGVDELEELDGWSNLPTEVRNRVRQLLTTQSHVFSIYVTARRATGEQDDFGGFLGGRPEDEEEQRARSLTRTVRSVVWRHEGEDGFQIVPIVRWEVLDYVPFEVRDYPDEGY